MLQIYIYLGKILFSKKLYYIQNFYDFLKIWKNVEYFYVFYTFFLKSYIVLDYGMSINLSMSIIQYSLWLNLFSI